jgi:hypothetical protein
LRFDLRQLPQTAFKQLKGPKGRFYQVSYELGLLLGAGGIEFRFIFKNKITGVVIADYS